MLRFICTADCWKRYKGWPVASSWELPTFHHSKAKRQTGITPSEESAALRLMQSTGDEKDLVSNDAHMKFGSVLGPGVVS